MQKNSKTRNPNPKKADKVQQTELKYLPKMYQAWEKVQSLMNQMDAELNLKRQPQELMHFDFACSAMEQAFERLDREIKERTGKD